MVVLVMRFIDKVFVYFDDEWYVELVVVRRIDILFGFYFCCY